MRENGINRIKVYLENKDKINPAILVNNRVIDDFIKFKEKNELQYCSMKQSDLTTTQITATFSTTIKYANFDQSKMMKDFESFCELNKKNYCTITKLTCQDLTYIAEFSVERDYMILN